MDTFKAGVKYNDFKGTVAADASDNVALNNHLVSLGTAQSDEYVVAFRISSGENLGNPVTSVSLVVYLQSVAAYCESSPKEVRAVEIQVTPGQALAFFKRLDVVATRKGLDLSAAHVDGPHYP